MCGCLSHVPHQGPGPRPRHVPWLGIELVILGLQAGAQSTEPHQPGPNLLLYINFELNEDVLIYLYNHAYVYVGVLYMHKHVEWLHWTFGEATWCIILMCIIKGKTQRSVFSHITCTIIIIVLKFFENCQDSTARRKKKGFSLSLISKTTWVKALELVTTRLLAPSVSFQL